MRAEPDVRYPAVSVIMPLLDEQGHLRGAVRALLASRRPAVLEPWW
ncbi:hypothetical protein EV284_5340 [Streptomyces sp. BK022]|nr:hypothetical protein [Streptomyces sp. BK022]RZU29129.1 hypothetical protein EV284_5340 [Streptomyces sp. BK022]